MRYILQAIVILTTFLLIDTRLFAQANLPTSFSGSGWTSSLPTGWTQTGMGTDYTTTYDAAGNAGKFDQSGDALIIYFNAAPATLTYYLQSNGLSGAYVFYIEESADGVNWTMLQQYAGSGIPTIALATSLSMNSSSRYARFRYTTKVTGNVGIDGVSVSSAITGPMISVSPTTLSNTDMNYILGSGPSAGSYVSINGAGFSPAIGNISASLSNGTASAFEASFDGGLTWATSGTIAYTGGTIAPTSIVFRTKGGLATNTYNDVVTISGGGANTVSISVTGIVHAGTASTLSDLISSGGESISISSLSTGALNTASDGTATWSFTIRDGGAGMNDADLLATIVTGINIAKPTAGYSNTIAAYANDIATAALFEGNTKIADAVIGTQLQFTGIALNIPDNSSRTFTLRITLKTPLGAFDDGKNVPFSIANSNFTTAGSGISSQKASFAAAQSIAGKNVIFVVATQLTFAVQPSNTAQGAPMNPAVKVMAIDANGNPDKDFAGNISITSSGSLSGTPVHLNAAAGTATFTGLIHNVQGSGLIFTTTATGLGSMLSDPFDITFSLQPGDLGIMAFNVDYDGSGNDELSIIPLVDIPPGVAIDFTDNAYEKCSTPGGWGTTEGWFRLTRSNHLLTKGTVFTIRYNITSNTAIVVGDADWTSSLPQPSGQGRFNLNANGEQLFILSGGAVGGPNTNTSASDAGTYTGGRMIYAFNTKGNIWTPVCGSATVGGTQNSARPENFDCFLAWPSTAADKNVYTGVIIAATQRQWLNRLKDPANWSSTYTSAHLGQIYTINAGGYSNGVWTGENSNWFDCRNWESLYVPDSSTDVMIGAGTNNPLIDASAAYAGLTIPPYTASAKSISLSGNKILSMANTGMNTLLIANHFTINNGGFLGGNGLINLGGNYTVSGTSVLNPGNGSITLNGGSAQSISTTIIDPMFHHVVFNNPNGFNVTSPDVAITGQATFNTGLVNTSTGKPIIFQQNATAIGVGNASFVNGPVQKTGNTAFMFPIGKDSVYRKAGISAPALATDIFTAEYFPVMHPQGGTLALGASGLHHVSSLEYWTINRNSGSSTPDITLSWNSASNVWINPIADLRVAHFNGSSWDNLQGISSGNVTAGTITAPTNMLNSFIAFTLATTNAGQPLPVKLISFSGNLNKENGLLLEWVTGCEASMKDFTIEHATGNSFTALGSVSAQNKGCSEHGTYNYKTVIPAQTTNLYRLRMTDLSAHITYSNTLHFESNALIDKELSITPIPAADFILVKGMPVGSSYQVFDASGRIITESISANGEEKINIGYLQSGIYFIRVTGFAPVKFEKK